MKLASFGAVMMVYIPAIDVLGGKCVRLRQGSYADVTSYEADPASVARRLVEAGAGRIHLVDLDAARGSGDNRAVIRRIRAEAPCVLELGGGVRTADDAEALLSLGIDRLVVGTTLAREPRTVASWVRRFGDVFIAGIDARNGEVRVSGWEEGAGVVDTDLARTANDIGMISIIYTSIAVDGMMSGPDLGRTAVVAEASGLPVIVSGGVGSLADVRKVLDAGHPGIVGIISGKAIYEGRIDVKKAVELCDKHGDPSRRGDRPGMSEDSPW